MNTEMQTKIREWEAERDRNLRIHCPLVAAKFQRWIDRAKKEDGNKNTNNKKGGQSMRNKLTVNDLPADVVERMKKMINEDRRKAVVVDGKIVKADTWYRLENGELVEVD